MHFRTSLYFCPLVSFFFFFSAILRSTNAFVISGPSSNLRLSSSFYYAERINKGLQLGDTSFSSSTLPHKRGALSLNSGTGSGENLRPDFDAEKEAEQSLETIKNLIDSNNIMLFMKGNKLFPQCGFSNTAVQILRALDAEFETFDVLGDYGVREEIKKYSNWPTIPQLYIQKEFVGGADILIEMYQNGELKEMLDGLKK